MARLVAADIIAGATLLSEAELGFLDGVTAGTATASKAVVLDASKGVTTLTSATITTLTSPTVNATNVDAGASGAAGSVDVFPATASKGKLAVTCTDQTGDTTVSLVAGAMAAARTITIPDPGAAARVLLTSDTSASTATDATTLEITQECDDSARYQAAGGTLTLTVASHNKKTVKLDTATGSVVTLPAATGSGARFRFVVSLLATSNSHIVKVANASDTMQGIIHVLDSDLVTVNMFGFAAGSTADTITLDRTNTGSVTLGEWIEVEDFATNKWQVCGTLSGAAPATPFSAAV